MPDWKTRLAVSYKDEDNNTVDITPIDSFSPTFAINSEVLHSIEKTHIGIIYSPEQMTFTMTVKAIGDVAAKLTALAMQGKHFDITLQENDGTDWAFTTVVMSDCLITSANPTSASPTGAPTATFSGISLGANITDKANANFELPA
jgi:hypothetical protein